MTPQDDIDYIEDHNGYYQGPLGIETDQPQVWTKSIILILTCCGALMMFAAIWLMVVAIIRII